MKARLLDKYKARVKRHLVVLKMTFSYFATQKVGYRAVALAFFTTIAFLPCLAMILKIVSGFGLQTYLETMLYETFDGNHDLVKNAFEYDAEIEVNVLVQ